MSMDTPFHKDKFLHSTSQNYYQLEISYVSFIQMKQLHIHASLSTYQ